MEKILQKSYLFDFYADLLTEKQKTFYEMYYLNDFSLNEIAEEYGITPQAVRDLLNRTDKLLSRYEEGLKMIERHINTEQAVNCAIEFIDKNFSNEAASQEAVTELKDKLKGIIY